MSFENEMIYDTDDIRPPDQVVCEQLLPSSNVFSFPPPSGAMADIPHVWCDDETFDRIMQESKLEFDKYADHDVLCEYQETMRLEKQQRELRFHTVKTQIHKLMKLDTHNAHVYTALLNAFALFEDGYISHFNVENEFEYVKYMGILKTIRLSIHERADLTQFICFVQSLSD